MRQIVNAIFYRVKTDCQWRPSRVSALANRL
ncbi:MAG: transposase [Kiritimatiellae bacterium]|nr:transposase [Kiritimatiellia bacterium]